ncbi:MAG: M24 family metallopeptidase [Candidatus Binatia bacterium]
MKEPMFAEFPSDEYELRIARARALMETEGIDALLLTQQENVRYLAGYLSLLWISKFRPLLALLPRNPSISPTLILPGQEYGNAKTSWIEEIAFYRDQEDPIDTVVNVLHKKGLRNKTVGVELGYGSRLGMAQVQWEDLRRSFAGTFTDSAPLLRQLRGIKSPREIAMLQRACEISCIGVEAGWRALREGMSEKELAAIMISTMIQEGAEPMKTFLCVTSGPLRYQIVNCPPSDYRLKRGDLVMIDGGATYNGYCTDFIRQACLGTPTSQQREWFDLAKTANDTAIAAIRPGARCADVYDAGRQVFIDAGLGDYGVINIIGHACGMEVHELPYVGERGQVETSDTIIEPGMVFCIEPIIAGMDSPRWEAGIFIQEDMVAVNETSCDILTTKLSKDLWLADG